MDTQLLARATQRFAQNFTIPVRQPGFTKPDFWSIPLTITRARPVPGNSGWVDILVVPENDEHNKVITKYILSAFEEDSITFRWMVDGKLLAPSSFSTAPVIEKHVDRFIANPYPAKFRDTFIWSGSGKQIRIQVNNANQVRKLAYAAVAGWYYPSLGYSGTRPENEGVSGGVR